MDELLLTNSDISLDSIWAEQYQYNLNNRILIFNGEVDNEVIENYIHYILRWNKEDKDIFIKKRKEITIIINSIGGDSFAANSLINAIQLSKTRVRTVGIGTVASAAFYIFLAGDTRYSFGDTAFLMHEGEIIVSNTNSKTKQTMEFFDQMDNRIKQFILDRTCMDEEFYDSVYDQEYWMYPQEAKELGVVDKIIGEDCDIDEIL